MADWRFCFVNLTGNAANVYTIYGTADSPLLMPPAFQVSLRSCICSPLDLSSLFSPFFSPLFRSPLSSLPRSALLCSPLFRAPLSLALLSSALRSPLSLRCSPLLPPRFASLFSSHFSRISLLTDAPACPAVQVTQSGFGANVGGLNPQISGA